MMSILSRACCRRNLFNLHSSLGTGARKMAAARGVMHGHARLSEFLLCQVGEVDNRGALRLSRNSGRACASVEVAGETRCERRSTNGRDKYREHSRAQWKAQKTIASS